MRARKGQNILDICLQEYGDLEQLFDIIVLNKLGVNFNFGEGQEVIVNTNGKGNQEIKDFIRINKLTLNNRSLDVVVSTEGFAIQWPIYVDLDEAINLNKRIDI